MLLDCFVSVTKDLLCFQETRSCVPFGYSFLQESQVFIVISGLMKRLVFELKYRGIFISFFIIFYLYWIFWLIDLQLGPINCLKRLFLLLSLLCQSDLTFSANAGYSNFLKFYHWGMRFHCYFNLHFLWLIINWPLFHIFIDHSSCHLPIFLSEFFSLLIRTLLIFRVLIFCHVFCR